MRDLLRWWGAPGRLAALAILAVATALFAAIPQQLDDLRLHGFDAAQRLWPQSAETPIVQIVDIDEESLRRHGQWPWPWVLVADLVQRIGEGKPRALGIDILFPERDRFSPPYLAESMRGLPPAAVEALAGLPSSEARLAEAIAAVPTVLAMGPSEEAPAPGGIRRPSLLLQSGAPPHQFLAEHRSMIRSRAELGQAARSQASIGVDPDRDGVVRRVPLLTLVEDQLVPALAVEVLRVAAGAPTAVVTTGPGGVEHVSVARAFTAPTDPRGRANLRFAPTKARYISAATVLDPAFDTRQFTGQIVLLGVSGLGLVDRKATPLGVTEGIEVHAQLIEALLDGALLQRPPSAYWIELALVLAAGLAATLLIRYERPAVAGAVCVGIGVALLGGELALFGLAGRLIDAIYPALTLAATFVAMLVGNFRASQAARRRLAAELEHERELKARLEGELAAARSIQMGLLPHHFPAFPERGDIDLFARIEPARDVGGDLFDYLLIDNRRLFFFIADVSGKGIPAALFMAMTKEVVRDAAARHGAALDGLLGEANAKIAAASNELVDEGGHLMFVTAFAGVLDLGSGEVVYASAGHDSPFVVQDGRGLRQLDTQGGPPLGAVEDFRFPLDRDRLEPGAVLLLYTDGVTEAQDAAGALYSARRLADHLAGGPAATARSAVDAAFDDVRRFVGGAEQADDITVLAIRRLAGGSPAR